LTVDFIEIQEAGSTGEREVEGLRANERWYN